MMINLQDIYDLVSTGKYSLEYYGDAWSRGYVSIIYADPECPSEAFLIHEGKGTRKGEFYYDFPSTKSTQYHHRKYYALYDNMTGERLAWGTICRYVLRMRANRSLENFNDRGCL